MSPSARGGEPLSQSEMCLLRLEALAGDLALQPESSLRSAMLAADFLSTRVAPRRNDLDPRRPAEAGDPSPVSRQAPTLSPAFGGVRP